MKISAISTKPFPLGWRATFANLIAHPIIHGSALLGIAEVGNRVSRIMTAVVLARSMSPLQFGTISLVLAIFELVRMFIHNGIGARIVQANEAELGAVCTGAMRVNWIVGVGMCALQSILAYPLQHVFGQPIADLLIALSIVHVIYPIGMVHVSLAQRFGRFGLLAFLTFLQITGDNLLTATFAFGGLATWAVVLPRLCIALIWVVLARRLVRWHAFAPIPSAMLRDIVAFTVNVFASEMLFTLRNQGDKLIVSKLLGIQSFSLYAFAANAGSGIATSIVNTLGTAVLPFLCGYGNSNSDLRRRFDLSLIGLTFLIGPLILAQTVLAPWYVPLIFGKQWAAAVPALIIACLGTIARPLMIVTQQVLRATGQTARELEISRWSTLCFFAALACGLPFDILGILTATSVASIVPAAYFAVLVRREISEPSALNYPVVEVCP